jgi:hypothetical protein
MTNFQLAFFSLVDVKPLCNELLFFKLFNGPKSLSTGIVAAKRTSFLLSVGILFRIYNTLTSISILFKINFLHFEFSIILFIDFILCSLIIIIFSSIFKLYIHFASLYYSILLLLFINVLAIFPVYMLHRLK